MKRETWRICKCGPQDSNVVGSSLASESADGLDLLPLRSQFIDAELGDWVIFPLNMGSLLGFLIAVKQ